MFISILNTHRTFSGLDQVPQTYTGKVRVGFYI